MFGRHGDHDLQVMPNCAASSNSDGRKAAIEEEGQEEETQAYSRPDSDHNDIGMKSR
jgi:hypothetical protein